MQLAHWRRAKLPHGSCGEVNHAVVVDILAGMLCCDLEQEYACECDHGVDVVWYADESIAYVVIGENVFDDRGGGCDRGDGAVVEVRGHGGAFEAAEDVGVEVEFGEVVVEDYAFGGEFAYLFVEF